MKLLKTLKLELRNIYGIYGKIPAVNNSEYYVSVYRSDINETYFACNNRGRNVPICGRHDRSKPEEYIEYLQQKNYNIVNTHYVDFLGHLHQMPKLNAGTK